MSIKLNYGDLFMLELNDDVYTRINNCKREIRISLLPHLAKGACVVTNTAMNGGGQSYDGGYPDGYHVYAEHMDTGTKFDFYQSGCFTCMIKNRKPIGTARQKWVVDNDAGGE